MAIINRDLDVSQQKWDYHRTLNSSVAASAGSNFIAWRAPFPCVIKNISVTAQAISGTPSIAFGINRFVVGAGGTTVNGTGATTAILAFGTSGAQAISLAATGSTLLNLQTNDILQLQALFSGGNVGTTDLDVVVVVQALQDIKALFGSST